MGWTPGDGLGLVDDAMTTHVKVSIKTDNAGLGAKLARKTKKDEFDSGECAGLDVFQRILGRLNGKEEQVESELERQRLDKIVNGKWGMHFVRGETLKSTWDAECKLLMESDKSKKRRLSESEEPKKRRKSDKKEKSEKKEKKDKKEKSEKKNKKDKKDKSEKKEKKLKDKSEKKEKKEKKLKDKKEKKEKSKKSSKSSKASKSSKSSSPEITRESMLAPKEAGEQKIATRLSARAKWIKQKRASVMDAKALNEIFMITN